MFKVMYDLVIIGAGPAGLCAGIYAARRELKILVIEKGMAGGQMALAPEIGNWPGIQSVPGIELASRMEEHAKSLGVEFKAARVTGLVLDGEVKKVLLGGESVECKALIIATGGEHRQIGVEGEKEFTGRGISYCATCDGPLFRDKTIAVVGGGNTAVEDAVYLSDIARKVYIIHRRDMFRAEESRVELMQDKGVVEVLDSVVESFHGDKLLKSVKVRNVKSGGISVLDVDGVFVSIGVNPSSGIAVESGVGLDDSGFINVDRDMRTSIDGVYAAGDVTGGVLQVATAVGEGCVAALSAYDYIKQPYWAKK